MTKNQKQTQKKHSLIPPPLTSLPLFLTLTHSHLKGGEKLRVGGGREEKEDKRE